MKPKVLCSIVIRKVANGWLVSPDSFNSGQVQMLDEFYAFNDFSSLVEHIATVLPPAPEAPMSDEKLREKLC